ncbi:MAG: phosphoribosylanthranilate isomerase [Geminicoccaceae bacterium]
MAPLVKVCGMSEAPRIEEACALGAAFVGFVFYPPSPRAVDPATARQLAEHVAGPRIVGLFVDAEDEAIDAVLRHVPLDILQLHGHETPERVRAIGLRTGLQTMKAIRVETADDLATLDEHVDAADLVLFDAKPPRTPGWLPGGNGLPFDWTLLADLRLTKPWALAGGLTPDNVAAAVRTTGAPIVDVSSGIESRPGVKDPARLASFLRTAASLPADNGLAA